MTTDLRAALRDAAGTLNTLARRSESSDRHPLVDPDEFYHAAKQYRAIADAPPTVAELLPMVDATHAEEWTATGGERMRIRLDVTGAQPFHRVECFCVSDGEWFGVALGPDDMNQPATLVEVSP